MKKLIVRLLLEGNQTLDIIVVEDEARKILDIWKSSDGKCNIPEKISGHDHYQDRMWAVDLHRVLAVFTIDPSTIPQMPGQQTIPGNSLSPWGSGR